MNDEGRKTLLDQWAEPPSNSEQRRFGITERVANIRNAIANSASLCNRGIRVSVQGSHRHNTIVRLDRDVDIYVILMDIFTTDYTFARGFSDKKLKLYDATYSYPEFRNDLEATFVAAFGRNYVRRGSKGFTLKEKNIHRVNSDVVAGFEHRRYRPDGTYDIGITLRPDNRDSFESWPEQHFQNGEVKNSKTERRYQRFVRIMKKLCDYMARHGYPQARAIPSYLNECLVYNTPNNLLSAGTLSDNLREMLAYLLQATETDEECRKWLEVTEMNYLFHSSRPWTREQAHNWILAAWEWLEYE